MPERSPKRQKEAPRFQKTWVELEGEVRRKMIEVSADIPMPVIFPTDTIPAPKNAALLKSH
jgi:hypothetical protein